MLLVKKMSLLILAIIKDRLSLCFISKFLKIVFCLTSRMLSVSNMDVRNNDKRIRIDGKGAFH
jgi:hypothetical protein